MKTWIDRGVFAGLDWASDHHDVVVVDAAGAILRSIRFDHTAGGFETLRALAVEYPGLCVALETSHGLAIEKLLEFGCVVYPVHPFQASRYRERKAPGGVKDDHLDAWALADALRVDGARWKSLHPEDPLLIELRLLCRDEIAPIEQRTALINQLRAALREYYPAALEAFEDWIKPTAWQFVLWFSPGKVDA